MELAQTVVNAFVVGGVGLVLGRMVHGLRSELKAEISEVRAELTALRSDLTQVALAVGVARRAGNQ